MVKKFGDICNRLDTIPACDRQTDGRTDILPRHSPRYAYASRDKNGLTHCLSFFSPYGSPPIILVLSAQNIFTKF